jgi:hypothetical protein
LLQETAVTIVTGSGGLNPSTVAEVAINLVLTAAVAGAIGQID